MIDADLERKLQDRVQRANKVIQACLVGILIVIVAMLGLILYQNQVNLAISRDNAAQNHKRTQAYVKCIAEALIVPLAQRDKNALEACTESADARTRAADRQGK